MQKKKGVVCERTVDGGSGSKELKDLLLKKRRRHFTLKKRNRESAYCQTSLRRHLHDYGKLKIILCQL